MRLFTKALDFGCHRAEFLEDQSGRLQTNKRESFVFGAYVSRLFDAPAKGQTIHSSTQRTMVANAKDLGVAIDLFRMALTVWYYKLVVELIVKKLR